MVIEVVFMTSEMVVKLISGCRAVRLWDRPS